MKYLFAYGSLVNDSSRHKTTEFIYHNVSYYAEISHLLGYIRVFNVRIIKNGIPQIMLGIEKSFNPSPINGILFKVSDSIIVAEKLAKKAQEKKITKIFLDRGNYKYHGRIKAFAETLRKNGMEF